MSTKTKKAASAVAATVLSSLLLLGGTLAWQSISQQAFNEASSEVNPGGRLHDDFDGVNKDIYVENFADEPIYARIRLLEYLEIGDAAGKNLSDPERYDDTGNITIPTQDELPLTARLITPGAMANDTSTWRVHRYEDTIINLTDPYFEWETGGSTVYLPTFNMNKDSVQADINGTLQGENGLYPWEEDETTADPAYSDHISYSTDTPPVPGYEIKDADSNNDDELSMDGRNVYDYITLDPSAALQQYIADSNIRIEKAEHAPRSTATARLISIPAWLKLYHDALAANPDPQAALEGLADYWVYDEDGWCYYSKPIPPDSATGPLLSGVSHIDPQDNYYYAIHANAQFITGDDIGSEATADGFYADMTIAPSEAALQLLGIIGVDVS